MNKNKEKKDPKLGKLKREKNLILWKPGQSGNPKGKPKGAVSLKSILQRFLDVNIDLDKNPLTKKDEKLKLTVKEAIYLRIIVKALNGDLVAAKDILNRADELSNLKLELEIKELQSRLEQKNVTENGKPVFPLFED